MLEPDDRPEEQGQTTGSGILNRIIAAVGLLLLVAVLFLYSFYYGPRTVPDLVGRTVKQAKALTAAVNLKVQIKKEIYHNGFAKGKIVTQDPAAGESIKKNSTVKVTVSKGPRLPDLSQNSVIVPNLIGLSVADALQALEKGDLRGSYKEEYNDVVEKGIIISQNTQAGSEAKVGEIVFFLVSRGKKETPTTTVPTATVTTGKVICIDPGHQTKADLNPEPIGPGSSTMKEKVRGGATGASSGTPENKITLQIALKLRGLLERAGYVVVMTRETNDVNISNAERAKIANQANANLFVRIHCDGSNDPSVNGISTLYPAKNQWTGAIYDRSLSAAKLVQAEVIKTTGRKNNGIVARGDMTGFNWSQVPVILVEGGFLSNLEEDRLLNTDEFQQKLAQGMFNGIVKYLQ